MKQGTQTGASDASTRVQELATDPTRSALARYRDLVIGRDGLWPLLRYEIVMMIAGSCPGALGLVLRRSLYPLLLGSVGRNVIFGRSVVIRHGHKIQIGDNVVIEDLAVLDAKGLANQGIVLGDGVMISRNTVLGCKGGSIRIGDRVTIGANSLVHAVEGSDVEVADDTAVAAYVYLIGGGNYVLDGPDTVIKKLPKQPEGGIRIGRGCWVGSHVQVLDGVMAGEGSVLAAGAVVTQSVAAFQIVGGVPAKAIGERNRVVAAGESASRTPTQIAL